MRAAANAGEEDTSKGLATRVAVVCEVQGRAGLREDKMHHMDVKLKTHTCSQGEPGKECKAKIKQRSASECGNTENDCMHYVPSHATQSHTETDIHHQCDRLGLGLARTVHIRWGQCIEYSTHVNQ